jgi:predicted protein tyrosine phosphatase
MKCDRQKLLFICSRNQWRSPTAEALFKQSQVYDARSAGTEAGARIKLTPGLLHWADHIFVMEKRHLQRIRQKYPDIVQALDQPIVILNISDDYGLMDEELIETLRSRLSEDLEL